MTGMPRRLCAAGARGSAWVLVLMLAVGALAGCHRTPAEQEVRQAIAETVTAARGNDVHGVLNVVSDDFTGNGGELDRHGLRQLLALRALRQDQTGVLTGPITIERQGDRMIAKFNLVLTGGKPGDWVPDGSAVYAMTTAWRRDGGRWRCYNAAWTGGAP